MAAAIGIVAGTLAAAGMATAQAVKTFTAGSFTIEVPAHVVGAICATEEAVEAKLDDGTDCTKPTMSADNPSVYVGAKWLGAQAGIARFQLRDSVGGANTGLDCAVHVHATKLASASPSAGPTAWGCDDLAAAGTIKVNGGAIWHLKLPADGRQFSVPSTLTAIVTEATA